MTTLRVHREPVRSDIHVAPGLLREAGALLRMHRERGRVLLVTDRKVMRLYGGTVRASLARAGFDVVTSVLPQGERAKSLAVVRSLYKTWALRGADRGAVVVALGGGVVSDVAGFAAATYARGLDWVALPTTLLAQADASVGGKVGVNLEEGKNLVGAYHHARGVYSDPDVLATLTPRAFRSGLAEVVKMGVIRRPGLLARVEGLARAGRLRDGAALTPLIRAAVSQKARVVAVDERDLGIRRDLNFGHTVGHALEAAYGYRRYLHGEAISVGMVAALRLSVLEVRLPEPDAVRVETLLRRLGLPTRLRERPGPRFWRALERDKKRGRKGARMVLSPAIGAAKVFDLPTLTSLRGVLLDLVEP
jgi:3-dehydroquinate synthase